MMFRIIVRIITVLLPSMGGVGVGAKPVVLNSTDTCTDVVSTSAPYGAAGSRVGAMSGSMTASYVPSGYVSGSAGPVSTAYGATAPYWNITFISDAEPTQSWPVATSGSVDPVSTDTCTDLTISTTSSAGSAGAISASYVASGSGAPASTGYSSAAPYANKTTATSGAGPTAYALATVTSAPASSSAYPSCITAYNTVTLYTSPAWVGTAATAPAWTLLVNSAVQPDPTLGNNFVVNPTKSGTTASAASIPDATNSVTPDWGYFLFKCNVEANFEVYHGMYAGADLENNMLTCVYYTEPLYPSDLIAAPEGHTGFATAFDLAEKCRTTTAAIPSTTFSTKSTTAKTSTYQ